MAVTAQSIIFRAAVALQDLTGIRWGADELVRALNDGLREMAIYRPDVFGTFASIALVVGARQALPAGAFKLLDIQNNTAGEKLSIRQVERRMLDDIVPAWRTTTGSTTVKHFVYDPRDPRAFYVYPPAAAGAAVDALYAVTPADVTEPAAGSNYSAVAGTVPVPDIYASALLDYVLFRAFSKKTEFAGDAGRALAHYQAFTNALGVEIKSTALVAPIVGQPGVPGVAV